MKTNNILGIVFANAHDAMLSDLTKNRSMASVPFGGRYRIIDFVLSNFTNAGIGRVGLITKTNYLSLTNHLSNGKPWDLDRKNGGLCILPPFVTGAAQYYTRKLEMLNSVMEFLTSCVEEYVILGDSDVVTNIDIKAFYKFHKKNEADISVVCAKGRKPKGYNNIPHFKLSDTGLVEDVSFGDSDDCYYSLDIIIIKRELLIDLVNEGIMCGQVSLSHGVFERKYKDLKIHAFIHRGFSAVMDSIQSYFDANMALLKSDIRQDLFNRDRPIFTKSRDDMPVKYGLKSEASNSLIADGCVIKGTVKNSVLFRGVTVEEGAVVENCVLMDDAKIGAGCKISNVISDRQVEITPNKTLDGMAIGYYIDKNKII